MMRFRARCVLILLLSMAIPYSSLASEGEFLPLTTGAFEEALKALLDSRGTAQDIVAYDPDLGEPDSETQAVIGRLQSDNLDAVIILVPAREKLHAQVIERHKPDESGLPGAYTTDLGRPRGRIFIL